MGNPIEFFQFRVHTDPILADIRQDPAWKGIVNRKLENAAPYYFFLTKVQDCFETYFEDLTISFPELLDESLGTLEHTIHINFMVDVNWLLAQYGTRDLLFSSMTIICGIEDVDLNPEGMEWNIRVIRVPPKYRFGKMHTKMSIFFYTDKSVRFVVSTANLTKSDWTNRTQGVWISPKCPFMGDDIPINYGESETFFKLDVIKYLASYDLPELQEWIFRIQKCDLSAIRVCLVTSIPGEHNDESFGLKKLKKLVRENVNLPDDGEWDFVAQCSSIGFLGPSPHGWFETFSKSLQGIDQGNYYPAKVIFPSVRNVIRSLDGIMGAGCLPYSSVVHRTQRWLRRYLHDWQSDHRCRTGAIPHIKSYARLSKDGKKVGWFLLTSANLSKAAWGTEKPNGKYVIFSHEVGVLFLPRFFLNRDTFRIRNGGNVDENKELFPLPYDSPITPYAHNDDVFLVDKCYFF